MIGIDVDTWIYETITAAVAGTAAAGRVYGEYIPQDDTAYPAVTFSEVDPGSPVYAAGDGTQVVWENILVDVKVHTIGTHWGAGRAIINAILPALEARGETDNLWIRVCRREGSAIKQYEIVDGVRYNAIGYQFLISAQAKGDE
jgi:hypothetical protein